MEMADGSVVVVVGVRESAAPAGLAGGPSAGALLVLGDRETEDSLSWSCPKPASGLAPPATWDGPGLVMGAVVFVER